MGLTLRCGHAASHGCVSILLQHCVIATPHGGEMQFPHAVKIATPRGGKGGLYKSAGILTAKQSINFLSIPTSTHSDRLC